MKYSNRPPHFYQNESMYFLTARTINSRDYFNSDEKKKLILSALKIALEECKIGIFAWVILDNHYHCQIRVKYGVDLPKFVQRIHGLSARNLNKSENIRGRKIWWNYWDKCLNSEKDFWTHFNYINNNPIKHGFIRNTEELVNYPFSSYYFYLKKFGVDWLNSCFEKFPIVDFTLDDD